MDKLAEGLEKLVRSDPSVEYYVTSKGENIISTCGEVHLEKCLKDLKDDFIPDVPFTVGEPIIPFKETILNRQVREKPTKKVLQYEELNSDSESDFDEERKDAPKELSFIEFLE